MRKSDTSHAVLDEESRLAKTKKIIAVVEDRSSLEGKRVLDIGTGSGHIANAISAIANRVVSVDVVDERQITEGYDFILVQDEGLPFCGSSFDVIISNHVIEHVHNQKRHIGEANRVSRARGIVYLATPNKYWFTDPHYNLPFLSWLPRSISNCYLNLVQGNEWDIYPLSRGEIHRLAGDEFRVLDFTLKVLDKPERYNLQLSRLVRRFLRFTPVCILQLVRPIVPTHIVILAKRG